MSNFYPKGSLLPKGVAKRVINSDEIFEQKLKERQEQERRIRMLTEGEDTEESAEFVEGIMAQQLEPEEEPLQPEIDFEELQRQADEIIFNAQNQAEQIIDNAKAQAKEIMDKAVQEGKELGYEDGKNQAIVQMEEEKSRIEAERNAMQQSYQEELEALEPKLLDVILEVVDRVFHIQFSEKKEILLYLIQNTLSNIEGGKEFVIRTAPDNVLFLQAQTEGIQARVGQGASIDFVSDPDMTGMQCVIESSNGIFECGSDVQLENLIADLKSLCS
ncbi:FliH/SctL family protein [Eubacterium oxidoreducens]|uniref:FliH/SctL family protein n=1 Tax=Eubacterium oxidoreducens TaxID=1732 RepID=UPI000AD9A5DB|nr:FliH/SctL family protein [Eubacterium oxidoreducens]